MIRKNIFFALLGLITMTSCGSNPLDVDASGVQVNIIFEDINETIMSSSESELLKKHGEYKEDFKDVYAYLTGYCMEIGDVEDSIFLQSVSAFRDDSTIQNLNSHLIDLREKKGDIEGTMNNGFRHLKYHLPDVKLPTSIVYINSLFRSSVFCTEEEIGIGLEQYLGPENEVIKKLNNQYYYDWMKQRMRSEFMERDVLTGWIETHIVPAKEGNLAENIVRWGKIIYLTEAAFPEMEQHLIMRYSEEQLDWALNNEYAFWEYLVNEKLLFETNDQTTRNMIGDGPFTPGLPEQDSPDRLGQFIGWRMVHKYMEKNDVTVQQMLNVSYNDILQEFEID